MLSVTYAFWLVAPRFSIAQCPLDPDGRLRSLP